MHSVGRLFLALAAVGTWSTLLATGQVQSLVDPESDLWKVPTLFAQIEAFQTQAEDLDRQYTLLGRISRARQEIVESLREQRLTPEAAVNRFVELAALRSASALPGPKRSSGQPIRALARFQLLGWLRQERLERQGEAGDDVLQRAEAELRKPLK